jgi:hypothetical protein
MHTGVKEKLMSTFSEETVAGKKAAEKKADAPESTTAAAATETDTITGGDGNDSISGGAGADILEAAEGETEEGVRKVEIPDEVSAALEEKYPVLQEHGSHNAAMSGLQTDASGAWSPPPHPRFEQ